MKSKYIIFISALVMMGCKTPQATSVKDNVKT